MRYFAERLGVLWSCRKALYRCCPFTIVLYVKFTEHCNYVLCSHQGSVPPDGITQGRGNEHSSAGIQLPVDLESGENIWEDVWCWFHLARLLVIVTLLAWKVHLFQLKCQAWIFSHLMYLQTLDTGQTNDSMLMLDTIKRDKASIRSFPLTLNVILTHKIFARHLVWTQPNKSRCHDIFPTPTSMFVSYGV